MTTREFYRILAKTRNDLPWKVTKDDSIRAGSLCPLTAVCRCKTGLFHSLSRWDFAAEDMDLCLPDAGRILKAADTKCGHVSTRKALLKAIGLEENRMNETVAATMIVLTITVLMAGMILALFQNGGDL